MYTESEARELGLAFVHWKDADSGEWCIGDDGYVSQVLKRHEYRDRQPPMIVVIVPYGIGLIKKSARLLFEDYVRTGNPHKIGGGKKRDWAAIEAKRERTRRTVMAYVSMFISGKIDWDLLGNIYRSEQKIPRATVKRLFRNQEVQKMIREELKKTMEAKGLTPEWVFDKVKKAADIAEGKEDGSTLLRVAQQVAEWSGVEELGGGYPLPPMIGSGEDMKPIDPDELPAGIVVPSAEERFRKAAEDVGLRGELREEE